MPTNRGTHEGDIQEIAFVKDFNKNKHDDKYKLLTKGKLIENLYMVRVTTNQHSSLSGKNTKTRADCYLIYSNNIKIKDLLIKNDYYLSEQDLKNLQYKFIEHSGISIKLQDSEKYQILKVGPHSFNELFGNYELGAGASLFCLREEELIKNKELIDGWNSSFDKMKNYFYFVKDINEFTSNKETCQKVKTYCNKKITDLIDGSDELKQKIFNGYPIYQEPYSAWYLYSNNRIKELNYIPFVITTGSGRSHGDYTIVLKPKKED